MRPSAQDDFFLAPGLVLLNHASYGLASRHVTEHADRLRQQIETDPTFFLGPHRTERLRQPTRVAEALVPGAVTYLQMSFVSSSSAVHFPVAEVADWVHRRGGLLILDVAHGPDHVPLEPLRWGVDAAFGTVHKWFPALRPVGLLWLSDSLALLVRPAEVSLNWDSTDLVERFSWPGTFDPAPRLSLDAAVEQWRSWHTQWLIEECRELADHATNFLAEAGVRAWVGPGTNGECILRLSTHIYNDVNDIKTVASQLKETLS